MSQYTETDFRRRQLSRSAGFAFRAATVVIAGCLAVHVLNGLVLERAFLDFSSYDDYADLAKVRDAFGSPLWVASGLAHLVTSAAVVWWALAFGRLAEEDRPGAAQAARVVSGVAAAGFLLLAVTLLQGAGSASLFAEESPGQADTVYAALAMINVTADGVAIAAAGVLVLLVSRSGRATWPRWFVRLGHLAFACGLLQAVVYAPLFLFVGLAWFVSLAVVLGRDA